MTYCAVKGCHNSTHNHGQNIKMPFHGFPFDPTVAARWIEKLRLNRNENNWKPTKHTKICSMHFDERDKYFTKGGLCKLRQGAVPTKELHIFCTEDSNDVCNNVHDPHKLGKSQLEDSTLSDHEIRVFCPKCKEEVKHTAEGIQEDQTKILIANVYHYFEQEYEELKAVYGDLDLTPLSKFRQRTALATGVSESRVLQILKDEEERNAEERQEPPEERRRARKRSIQTDSSSEEDNSDDNASKIEQSSTSQDIETLVVKEEPAEYSNDEPEIYIPTAVKEEPGDEEVKKGQAQTDPISVDVKTEPQLDDNTTATDKDNTNETLAETEPAGTKRKGRKAPRRSDVTSTRTTETVALTKPAGTKRKGRKISTSDVTSTRQQSPGEPSTAAASSSVQLAEELDESSLISDYEVKLEEMEIHEEGLS